MKKTREVLRIVVVGHVDHGKSTVIGRLLCDTKSLPDGAVEKVKRISKESGKPFEFAYLLDAFEEEQKQGITIDTTQLQFKTDKRDYVIIDAPGHKEFLKNMVSGAASAEAALLIVDAEEGIQEQSKRHGYILSLLGIEKINVVVSKMDLIDYSEEKFNTIKKDIKEFFSSLDMSVSEFIPVSGFLGENIAAKSDKMPWYKGGSVLDALDKFETEKGLYDKELRLPIQDVYKFDNRRIITGRIESGSLKAGDEILIAPTNKVTRVKTIEHWSELDKTDRAYAGMSIGITLEDEFFNKRGEIICHKTNLPLIGDILDVNLFWLGKETLNKSKKYKLKLLTQEVECEVLAISKIIDASNLETIENRDVIKTNDVAEVSIKTSHKICFDTFSQNPNTGRFVLVDGYTVAGGGIVKGIKEKQKAFSRFMKDGTKMSVSCFEDYFYMVGEGTIKLAANNVRDYDVGEVIAIKGETYSYPENFNIIDLHSGYAAKVRGAELKDIIEIDTLEFDYFPSVNVKGAYIKLYSQKDLDDFKQDYEAMDTGDHNKLAEFANKWLVFVRYRTIKYR